MTEQQHPINPPLDLIKTWMIEYYGGEIPGGFAGDEVYLCKCAAQWGADQAVPKDAHGYIAWILFQGDGKLRPEAREVLTARGIISATSNELEQLDD